MKVSLILTTYNCKENFLTTMESILMQDYPDIEIVIKDGGSTDGTLELIETFAEKYPKIVWRTSPDVGIYDALNQGIKMSSGDIIAVCNDRFTRADVITLLIDAINEMPESLGVHADLVYADADRIIRRWRTGRGRIRTGWMPGHPTLYLKREVYEQCGLYDTTYRCSADYEFMVRALTGREERLAYVPETLVSMYYGGTSTGGIRSYLRSIFESHKALVQNGIHPAWWIIFLRTLKTIRQF